MQKLIGVGVALSLLFSSIFAAPAVRDCFSSNVAMKELNSAQKKCLRDVLRNLPVDTRTHLYQGLQRNDWPSPAHLDDANLRFLERNIRNKRTLNFVLQSLMGFGINRALSSALMPPAMPTAAKAAMPAMSAGMNSTQPPKPLPTSPPPAPVTLPPNQIDANTIRYPFRPAPGIPFLAFAPLPAGVTAPYPPLLQWPTRAPSPLMSPMTPAPTPSKPCTCTTKAPPAKQPDFLEMPQVPLGNKPYLPISGTMFGFSLPTPNGNSLRDSSDDENEELYHNYDYSFDHGTNNNYGPKNPHYDKENSEYRMNPAYEDDEEAEYLRSRERLSQKRHLSHLKAKPKKVLVVDSPHSSEMGFDDPFFDSYSSKPKVHRSPRAQFRIVIPPLPPRKRRDIFFDDAFKSFNMSAFDFHKSDPVEQPESTQAQFLEVGNSKFVPSLDYRRKLERDLEKYVETYVEQQITQGVIDVTKPKKTVVELKTKQGPPIKTVTTTVSKLIDGDKTLLESIFDFSKSINPVANLGELSGVEEPPATNHASSIDSGSPAFDESIEDSPVSRAFKSNTFGAFSWNNLFK